MQRTAQAFLFGLLTWSAREECGSKRVKAENDSEISLRKNTKNKFASQTCSPATSPSALPLQSRLINNSPQRGGTSSWARIGQLPRQTNLCHHGDKSASGWYVAATTHRESFPQELLPAPQLAESSAARDYGHPCTEHPRPRAEEEWRVRSCQASLLRRVFEH